MYAARQYKRTLQAFQSWRLQRDYADLSARPEYRGLAEFFFEELYGPRDFSSRDTQACRVETLLRLIPGLALRDIIQIFQLLDLSNRCDEAVAAQLKAMGAPLDFDEALYEEAYRLASSYAVRDRQLVAIHDTLHNVHRLAHMPLIGMALDSTPLFARLTGLPDIHRFLQRGYHALNPMPDIHEFVTAIDTRERARLDRIYETASVAPVEALA